MMRILGLLGKVRQIVKRCLNYADFTGPITTTIVDPVPFIIYDDPNLKGSFLFAEEAAQSGVSGQESANEQSQTTRDNQKIIPGVNDELAKEYHPQPSVDRPRWLVNDDLAACSSIANCQLPIVNCQSEIHNSQLTIHNNNSSTKPNKNDAIRPFASFVFFIRRNFSEGGIIKNIFPELLNEWKRVIEEILYARQLSQNIQLKLIYNHNLD